MNTMKTVPENNFTSSEVASNRVPEAIHAHDIGRSSWAPFCAWLTSNLSGVSTTVVRDEGADRRLTECIDRQLERVEPILQANGVPAVRITVGRDGNRHLFDVSGPSWLRVHYNAAGFIRLIEIGYEEGKMVLLFAGTPILSSAFTANSWGE